MLFALIINICNQSENIDLSIIIQQTIAAPNFVSLGYQ